MEGKDRKNAVRTVAVLLAAALFAIALYSPYFLSVSPVSPVRAAPAEPTPARRAKYNEFPHSAKAHQVDCAVCHTFPSANWNKVRTGTAAFPDVTEYPKHDSCVKCHMQQFFKGARPAICSICHTNPSPRDSSRHPFPNPREIFDQSPKGKKAAPDFAVTFPHDKHIEIVSRRTPRSAHFVNASFAERPGRMAEESCAVCHQTLMPQGTGADEYVTKPPAKLGDGFWLKKGMFKSSPVGHTTCFTCHSTDAGILPAPQSCAACHQLKQADPLADFDLKFAATINFGDKIMMDLWRRRDAAGTFRHEFFGHAELSCATCHNVTAMNTSDPATKRVSIAACAACHATPTSDDGGALNYEIDMRAKEAAFGCVKCHITFGKLPVPDSHRKAIAGAAGK